MGLHTWFYKSRDLYEKIDKLYDKLEDHENGLTYLDDMETYQIENEIEDLDNKNKTEFHDCFRTYKREPDGSYTLDVIYSEEECNKWIEDNKDTISYMNKDCLSKFWNKYPDGVIDFG